MRWWNRHSRTRFEGVPSAVFAGGDVVHVAGGGGGVAAGEPAVPVPFADRAAQVAGMVSNGEAMSSGRLTPEEGTAGGLAAQPRGPAGRAGQQRDRPGEDVLPYGAAAGGGLLDAPQCVPGR